MHTLCLLVILLDLHTQRTSINGIAKTMHRGDVNAERKGER
jgi:hypothetical protein